MDFIGEKCFDIVIITVNLNVANSQKARKFKSLILKEITGGTTKIIADLSKCTEISIAFLSTLVLAKKKLSENKSNIKMVLVRNESALVYEYFHVSNLFDIYNSRNEAIQSFKHNTNHHQIITEQK